MPLNPPCCLFVLAESTCFSVGIPLTVPSTVILSSYMINTRMTDTLKFEQSAKKGYSNAESIKITVPTSSIRKAISS